MAASFTDLYNYSAATGMVVPQTSGIKQSVRNAMIDVFGSSIDLSDDTANGRLVDWLVSRFVMIVNSNASKINYLNLPYASGATLDMIAGFFGITRRRPCRTRLGVTIYSDTQYARLANGSILEDYLGNQYVVQTPHANYGGTVGNFYGICAFAESPDNITEYSYHSELGIAICTEAGPRFPTMTNYKYTNHVFDQSLLTVVSAAEGSEGNIGRITWNGNVWTASGAADETDIELKTRISICREHGSGTCQSMANAIWRAVPDLRQVTVVSNDDTETYTATGADAGMVLLPHSIAVIVDGIDCLQDDDGNALTLEQQDSIRSRIAKTISENRSSTITLARTYPSGNRNIVCIPSTMVYYDGQASSIATAAQTLARMNVITVRNDATGEYEEIPFFEKTGRMLSFSITYAENGYEGEDAEAEMKTILSQYVSRKQTTLTKNECMSFLMSSIKGIFIFDMIMRPFSISNAGVDYVTVAKWESMNISVINFTKVAST